MFTLRTITKWNILIILIVLMLDPRSVPKQWRWLISNVGGLYTYDKIWTLDKSMISLSTCHLSRVAFELQCW